MLNWSRTDYDGGFTKVFHVCNTSFSGYGDLVEKYGGDNVFRSDDLSAIQKAHNQCMSGRNDCIRIYPGTYTDAGATDATAVTISKSDITIESATGNPFSVTIAAGADCEMFSVAATADFTTFRNLMFSLDTSSTTPQDAIEVISGAVGVRIQNCVFIGSDKATVAIDSEGDRLLVEGCRFEDVKTAIQSNGNYSVIRNNYFNSDNTGAVAIELTAGNWCEIAGNRIDLSGGTGDTGIVLANGCLLGICTGNIIHASASDSINPGSSTMSLFGNYETGSTTTDFTVTNSTALPKLVYT